MKMFQCIKYLLNLNMNDKDDGDYLQALISRIFPILPINSGHGSYSITSFKVYLEVQQN